VLGESDALDGFAGGDEVVVELSEFGRVFETDDGAARLRGPEFASVGARTGGFGGVGSVCGELFQKCALEMTLLIRLTAGFRRRRRMRAIYEGSRGVRAQDWAKSGF